MDSTIKSGGRVLVHCHAGMGRTGLTIGCYMLYSGEYEDLKEVMAIVQAKRPKAFCTKVQNQFIASFFQLLAELRIIFHDNINQREDTKKYLLKQSYLLHGPTKRKLQNCPILLYEICERITRLYTRTIITVNAVSKAIIGNLKGDEETETLISELKGNLNKWKWKSLYDCKFPGVIIQVMFDFLDQLFLPAIDSNRFQKTIAEAPSLTSYETEIIRYMAILCKPTMSIMNSSTQDKVLARASISLLGLRDRESKCFIGREIVDLNFLNSDLIESMKAYLKDIMANEELNGKEEDKNLSPSKVFTLSNFNKFASSVSELPNGAQNQYINRFEELMHDVEDQNKNKSAKKIKLGKM